MQQQCSQREHSRQTGALKPVLGVRDSKSTSAASRQDAGLPKGCPQRCWVAATCKAQMLRLQLPPFESGMSAQHLQLPPFEIGMSAQHLQLPPFEVGTSAEHLLGLTSMTVSPKAS